MLSKIRMYNRDDKTLDFVMNKIDGSEEFRLHRIDGINPVKAGIQYSRYARLPGGVYQASTFDARNIVIEIGYDPLFKSGSSYEKLRLSVYETFETGSWVRIRFYEDDVSKKYIDGYIESIEPTLFAKDPTLSIVVIATDPFFRSAGSEEYDFTSGSVKNVNHLGNVNSGFEATIVTSAETAVLTITNGRGGSMKIKKLLPASSTIRIDTRSGQKGAWRVNSSGEVIERLVGDIEIDGGWPDLKPGLNYITISSSTGVYNSAKLKFNHLYNFGV